MKASLFSAGDRKHRSQIWVGLFLLFAGSVVSAQDIRLYVIGKGVSHLQNSAAAPVQAPADYYPWEAFTGAFGFDNVEYTAITLTLPGGTVVPLEWSLQDEGWSLPDDLEYQTKAELDADVPDSATPYTFTFTPAGSSPIAIPLVLNGSTYPNAPQFLDYATTQAIDHTQDFEFSWTPFTGGTADDAIIVEIRGTAGDSVFQSGFPGAEDALDGTATSMTLPAGTLAEGRSYEAMVSFFKASDRETTLLPGATGLALYSTSTELLIRAAGTAIGPASTRLQFSFSHAPGSLLGSVAQVTYPVTTQYNLSFEAFDDSAPPASVSFLGPSGSQFETPVGSAGSFDGGFNSVSYYSPERTTGPSPMLHPPGGDYQVNYGALSFPFAMPDPEAAARMRVVVPVLSLNGANEITSISWSYFGTDGTASALHPGVTRLSVSVWTSTTSERYDVARSVTSVSLSNPVPLTSLNGIDFGLEDDLGNFFRSSHNVQPLGPPVIDKHPESFTVAPGTSVTFVVEAQGGGDLGFQWRKNGVDIAGANEASLTLTSVTAGDAGEYTVAVSNGMSVTSNPAQLMVSEAAVSFLINLSNRGIVGTDTEIMIPGFVISGEGTKRLLIRAIGPTLAGFGVPGALQDPLLRLFSGADELSSNDNWGSAANAVEIAQVSDQIGAFALAVESADSAILIDLLEGSYTVQASGVGGGTGNALVEVYDTDSATNPGARLINISNRGFVGAGDEIMIPGIIVSGNSARTFLIRAVGPTLGGFGVVGVLADTVVRLFSGDTQIATNDDWWNQPTGGQVEAVAAEIGAFALDSGSRDAALLITLNPGEYTVQASGAGGTTGVALVEVYETP